MLGSVEVRDGAGCLVEVSGARLRALLALLALRPGQVAGVGYLIDELWESRPPDGAANALQALVSRLRRALPDGVVESRPGGYLLAVARDQVDVFRFELLAGQGRALLAAGDPASAASTLRDALALWRGPALADAGESETVRAAVVRLDELRLAATEARIDADLRLGGSGTAPGLVAELEGLLAAYPVRETLSGLLMRALAAAGRRGAALEAYERVRERLAEQLGADPSAELAALHLEILRDTEVTTAAPSREGDGGAEGGDERTNLRAELTSFVGREADLERVGVLLREHRLVTLTGPGGAGKTRLAVEAARSALGARSGGAVSGGVWLAELAPVTDPAEVAPTVLGAFGLREQALLYQGRTRGGAAGGRGTEADALERLVAALAARRALLVLDNCEHLVGAAATVADRVLAGCPGMRILATSREPLNISGETLWPVGPLELPPDRMAEGRSYASVALFEQRARAVSPGFSVTAANAEAVHRICRALDGMPLAIELAAARMRSMTAEQVAARLDDRFRLLTGGSRTALPRHQTLRAVVDWSWDLLDDRERALLRRLSVFAGGGTLEAAEDICAGLPAPGVASAVAGPGVAAEDVFDLLAALVDKSLLVVRHSQDGPRYRMLEIIRAYGRERLAEAGESDELREAHARYFTQLAEASRDHLLAAEQLDWLRRLAGDQDNLHAAVRHAVAVGDGPTAVRLAAALGWYWFLRGMKLEGAELIGEAFGIPGLVESADPEHLAVAYMMGALLTADTPLQTSAADWLDRAAALAAQIPSPADPIMSLVSPLATLFGAAVPGRGPADPEILDDAVGSSHRWVAALARILRGHAALNVGRGHAQAEADFLAGASILAELGERWGQAVAFGGLAMLEGWRGEHAAAVSHYRQARELVAAFGSTEDEVQFRLFIVRELWLADEREAARAELSRALPDAERIGLPELRAYAAYVAGDLARLDGRPEDAREGLLRAVNLAAPTEVAQQLRAVAATGLGYLAGAEGDLDAARDWHTHALATARFTADAPVIAGTLVGLADLALRKGNPERAAELLGAGFAIRGTTDRSVPDEERVADETRSALGETRYGEAYQCGQRVTIDTLPTLVTVTPGA